MSNGDDEEAEESAAEGPVAEFEERLDDLAERLDDAETEDDLDAIETDLDAIEADLEDADLPEPDEDEEDDEAEDPRADLEDRIADLRDDLEDQRGPYAEDVADDVETSAGTARDEEWTEDGEDEAVAAVATFLEAAGEHVDVPADAGTDPDAAADGLESAAASIRDASLDPDEDAETIEALLAAAETLADDLEAAETWDDLTMREQLDAEGFYEVLTNENRKDFPPEWTAAKIYAKGGEVDQLLLLLEKMGDQDFMVEYVFELLLHLGPEAEPAFDELHQRAQKRDQEPIRILGKIGDERAVETLHEFVEDDGDRNLQTVTLQALGEIGSEESVQPVADRLVAEEAEVRSAAARALGLLGDTRAIEPLGDVLDDDEEDDTVRASAAWALCQIGTERALDVASEHADDRAYIVQAEAEKAASV